MIIKEIASSFLLALLAIFLTLWAAPNNSMIDFFVYQTILSILFGGLAGAIVNIFYSSYRLDKEYAALVLAFCTEAVHAFRRIVTARNLSKQGKISKGMIFEFMDASAVSKLASVCKEPEVIAAVIETKAHFFQINRHLGEASSFAVQLERTDVLADIEKVGDSALKAQNTALGFFKSCQKDLVININIILTEARKVNPIARIDKIESIFKSAIEDLDSHPEQYVRA